MRSFEEIVDICVRYIDDDPYDSSPHSMTSDWRGRVDQFIANLRTDLATAKDTPKADLWVKCPSCGLDSAFHSAGSFYCTNIECPSKRGALDKRSAEGAAQ